MRTHFKTLLLCISTLLLFAINSSAEEGKRPDPSKTGKKTANSIFNIKLKQDKPRQNKLLDAANDLVSGKKKSADKKKDTPKNK
jgi:hypothetical protein